MSFSLSLNPVAVFEYFRSKTNRNRDQVAEYLDEIAKEARALAEVWDSVIQDLLEHKGKFDLNDHKEILLKLGTFKEPNRPYFSRLAMFYRDISQATAGKLPSEKMELVVVQLGRLLYSREITLKRYQAAIEYLRDSVFDATQSDFTEFSDLSTLSGALHEEAAALEVLAKTIKVQQG